MSEVITYKNPYTGRHVSFCEGHDDSPERHQDYPQDSIVLHGLHEAQDDEGMVAWYRGMKCYVPSHWRRWLEGRPSWAFG